MKIKPTGLGILVLCLLGISILINIYQTTKKPIIASNSYDFKGIEMDIDCREDEVCIVKDLHLKTKEGVNDWWFRDITEGYGKCGSIQLPNRTYGKLIYCGENMTMRVD